LELFDFDLELFDFDLELFDFDRRCDFSIVIDIGDDGGGGDGGNTPVDADPCGKLPELTVGDCGTIFADGNDDPDSGCDV
jgi:hypothetical protein